jgi:hypothetical protein
MPLKVDHDSARSISSADAVRREIEQLEDELVSLEKCSASWSQDLAAKHASARDRLKRLLKVQLADYQDKVRDIQARLDALG